MSNFGLMVYDQNGNGPLVDLRHTANHVRVGTILDGGCAQLSFRVPAPPLSVPYYCGPNYRVDVLDGSGVFWAGRMELFQASSAPDGQWWDITVRGYAVNGDDQHYTSQNVAATETSTIISNALSLMPQIGASTIDATGYTLGAGPVTLRLMKGASVIGWATQFGDSSTQVQQWHVYPDSDRTIRFTLEPRPTTPNLYIALRQLRDYRFGFDLANFANKVTVQYSAGAAFSTAESTTIQAQMNLIRAKIAVMDELVDAVDAAQVASSLLEKYSVKKMSATTLTVNPDAVITDANGASVPLWRVRSGKLCRITDVLSAGNTNDVLTYNNSFIIVGTQYDEDTGLLVITPESYESYLQNETAKAKKLLDGRHTIHT